MNIDDWLRAPRPEDYICANCCGTGEDSGLTCPKCDGTGQSMFARFWSTTDQPRHATITRELLDRAYFRSIHPMKD